METKNATIKSINITNADHGLLTIWLILNYGDSEQGFGGYSLGRNPNSADFNILQSKNYLGIWIWRIMDICEVSNWNDIIGKPIRVKCSHKKIYAIGHFLKNNWFNPDYYNIEE